MAPVPAAPGLQSGSGALLHEKTLASTVGAL